VTVIRTVSFVGEENIVTATGAVSTNVHYELVTRSSRIGLTNCPLEFRRLDFEDQPVFW
jgi:hypothetical protein